MSSDYRSRFRWLRLVSDSSHAPAFLAFICHRINRLRRGSLRSSEAHDLRLQLQSVNSDPERSLPARWPKPWAAPENCFTTWDETPSEFTSLERRCASLVIETGATF